MDSNSQMSWSFFQVWNQSLENRDERKYERRTHIWASELGGSYVDRFLKMRGVEPTNPPNARSLRKFEAGNMMEWVVGLVLKRSGILKTNQQWLSYQYPNQAEVTGKLDFFAGGQFDPIQAAIEIKQLELPEFFNRATNQIINYMRDKYPNGMREIVLEVKSCSSFMFDLYERTNKPNPNHRLQIYHYLKAKNIKEGHIVYICKDDLRMLELGVFLDDPETEAMYFGDIQKMTHYLQTDQQPPLEEEIIFSEDTGKFSKNWKVEYSNYLTMLYKYKTPEMYREVWDKDCASFNRTLKRVVDGAKMTPLNLEVIEKMKKVFPDYDRMVLKAKILKQKGLLEEEDATES